MSTYITASGAKRLAQELEQLVSHVRPRLVAEVRDAAAQGDRSENAEYIYGKKRLREVDKRLQFLTRRLDAVTVVRPEDVPVDGERVFFGASVTVTFDDGPSRIFRLVGPDEISPDSGAISYQSPLGRALIGRRLGDSATLQRPAGEVEIQVVAISYIEGE